MLSGLVGTLLAKGMEPFEAAAAGVLAHARAGQVAADRIGANHVIAGDVIEAIPEAMSRVSSPERAVARIDLGAIERNCAHLKSLLARGDAAVRGREGRRVRARRRLVRACGARRRRGLARRRDRGRRPRSSGGTASARASS